mgnify:CR=1 FL=1
MEYSVVVNGVEVVRVSGDEAAWTKFVQTKELVALSNDMTGRSDAWAELREVSGEQIGRAHV